MRTGKIGLFGLPINAAREALASAPLGPD